ncbi:tetratricopeptide repeat protein [Salegentibacter sp. F188]|uniref:Tetratricopeptide repeat protein n=1 Tax=Autumnicola patrickiae TaxID=3075591 RepID=A0ABU3E461_9FLAO|nr:tetratricopeptide repeat protein [Salegentibacter sp. F188]MDT0690787.1 tetratricopeptide repeat protein [Salegentibacter sp. F188]
MKNSVWICSCRFYKRSTSIKSSLNSTNPYIYAMRYVLSFCLFLFVNFSLYSQSEQLAMNYFDQGEYEKALKTYQQLLKENPANPMFFEGVVSSYQQLENFEAAEKLLYDKLNNSANNPNVLIELGHNFELKGNESKANQFYEEALGAIEGRPNYAYSISRGFEKYNLLDFASKAYVRAMELNPEMNFNLQLARLYGEQGKTEEMFRNYLDLIDADPKFFPVANREFNRFISEDASSEANTIFRKLLLKKLQENPSLIYNEILSWLFVQQKQYDRAFIQEKAMYRRGDGGLQGIINLAIIARDNEDLETAKEIIGYVIEESPSGNIILQGNQLLLALKLETAKPEEYEDLDAEFQQLLSQFGYSLNTLSLQIDYASFLAFKRNRNEEAVQLLKDLSEKANSDFDKASVKMTLADILVLEEKFNEALIYYSQVQKLVKNDEISQNARFKVAKTSYYKGDFEWAKNQLDVLKSSTSQLISNDAMELSLLIEDNSIEDSTQAALKQYARADLLAFQQKDSEAVIVLDSVLTRHKGEKIEDEALLKQAKLHEKLADYKKAEANYLQIIELYNEDILADNANFFLAELYANYLNEPEKAKDYYEQIIFNFADSIYFVDARKSFRTLRGDQIE